MKKRNLMVALLCSMCLAVSSPVPAMADGTKVVTLGADLTDEQKNTMMNYFKADASQVQVISVTNQDEHDLLGKYIPSEQIGTRTLSCAYVKPTQSGGIKVRTANLNYVTCNMIATALSTAGVTNCEVVAACPYEVSGTGALTGVMKAYESASGQELDSTKKDLAAKEVVVTGDVAQQVGQDNATNIINQAKMQIIGDNIQNADEIYNIVYNIAEQNGVSLSQDEIYTIVRDIYNSTIFSDIVKRNQVRKIDQLERVVKYTFNNVGNTFSAKSIADYLKAERRALDNETVYSYLEKLEKAYLLHRCSRYDLQGKEILKTQEKFYLADTALRYSVLGYNADSVASSLENIVYLELCRRGYTVNVGKTSDGEIDFVAVRQNEKIYVQVTQEINSEKTEKREYERLLEIHDNYPKYVLTTDEFAGGNYEGIKTMHIADFLLSSEY